ncbi:MAG TPA: hypothetical protein VFG08_04615, partial [Candidatus Polarisedimenticolia bacterium]|nr:hypothetical protein [Candidatus Polarisedimenticolia bacterium]
MVARSDSNRNAHFPFVSFTMAILFLIPIASPTLAQGTSQGGGTVPVLVKSKVALTPEIVAMISAHASRVTYVWPAIDAMALTVTPSNMAALIADPVVALVEPDSRGQAIADDEDLPGDLTSPPATVVPIFANGAPVQSWNIDMVDTTGTGYDGSGVTVAVLDSGLPQNWAEFLPPGSVDTTYAAGFGSEGFGDFHNPVNAIRGVGGHIGLFPHGLAVSSVIVGFPSDYGPVLGAAPGATIVPIRVLNQFNFGWSSWFTAAFLYV